MKKKGIIIFSILGVALIAVGVAFAIMSLPKKSNKEVFTEAIESALGINVNEKKSVEEKIDKITNAVKDNIYKVNVSMDSSMEEASSERANVVAYFGKGQFYGNINTDFNDNSQTLEGIYKDNKVYFTVKNVLSKYYYIENLEEMIPTNDFSKYNGILQNVLNYLKDSIINVIKEEDIVKDSEDITLNSKEIKATKYEYKITGNTLYEVIENFLNKVKNDKEIINMFGSLVETFKNEIKNNYSESDEIEINESSIPDFNTMINEILENAKDTKNLGDLLTISVYTYKDETVKTKISMSVDNGEQKIPMDISFDSFKENGLMYRKISLSQAGIELFSLIINQTSKTNYDIKLSFMLQEVLSGTLVNNDDSYNLKLKTSENFPTTLSLELNISKNNGYLVVDSDGSKLKIDFSYEEVSSMPNVDISNSAPYTEMTEKEKETLKGLFENSSFSLGYDENNMIGFDSDWENENGSSIIESSEDLDF